MLLHRIPSAVALLLLFTLETPVVAQPSDAGPDRWEPEIRAFEAADSLRPPPPGGVVFVGSSSIRMWKTLHEDFPNVPVLNRGFGGSEIQDAVHFADRIILPYRPRMVVVYAGDNDLANGKTPARVLEDYRRLVERVHEKLPETRVAFIAIKPSLARWHLIEQIREANRLVEAYSDRDPRLAYLDIFTPMLGPDGTPRPALFIQDGLHLSEEGYAVWKAVVGPALH